MNIYQVYTRPRHRRYMFFIEQSYPFDEIYQIIITNLSIWGGRYNPIVPVIDGEIQFGYLDIIRHYDPDTIFYSNGVDPEMIKKLRLFNPVSYVNMDVQPRIQGISGVNTFFFLTEYGNDAKVLLPEKIWPKGSLLPSFYELNFGLSEGLYHHEVEMSKSQTQVWVNGEKFLELNKIIHTEKPINVTSLSKRSINTRILRNLEHAWHDDFELIVANDNSTTADLIYYWNRGLYEHKNLMYVTLEQLDELCKDKFFGGVLHDLKGDHSIHVVSQTLDKAEIEDIIASRLRPIAFLSNFQYRDTTSFPYKVLDGNGLFERNYGESVATQTLVSDTGLIHIPKLSFGGTPVYLGQKFALDISIVQDFSTSQKTALFPLTSDVSHIAKGLKGRINLHRNITAFLDSQSNSSDTFQLSVPSFDSLVRQLICRPVINGERIENKIVDIGPHDPGNRLNAFINAFGNNFGTIYDFLSDKYWMDIFEELCTSEKVAGDTIAFEELVNRALQMYREQNLEMVDRDKGWFNLENLTLGLKRTIKELAAYQVFFRGFKLKCPNCASVFWYHINEINETITCRGCLKSFDLPIEPRFAYKLNDLVKNNIYKTKDTRDGNLTVIGTLAVLSQGIGAFQYSAQLNVYDDIRNNKPMGDLDIVVNDNGKFKIGEAKYNSEGFFENKMKSLKSIAELARLTYPDAVVLACSVDDNGKLEKACQSLRRLFKDWPFQPEIVPIALRRPDYWHSKSHRYFVH